MEHPARSCLAEIVADGDGARTWGSGYLVAEDWVLTAAHVVEGAKRLGVWLGAPAELRAESRISIVVVRVRADEDLALLQIPRISVPSGFEPPLFGSLDRESLAPVRAVAAGFPWFKLREAPGRSVLLREIHYATGSISAGSNARTRTLSLAVAEPPPALHSDKGHSPWEGMSGAAVFAGGYIVGVVGQHFLFEGLGALTLRPLEREAVAPWSGTLQQLEEPLPNVSPPSARQLVTHRARRIVEGLAPDVLVGRGRELTELARFAEDPRRHWRWIQADAFAGKTALLASFALRKQDRVDVAACFLRTESPGQNGFEFALDHLNEQLSVISGESNRTARSDYAYERLDSFAELLESAARASRQRSRRLLLLVDGLDEYDPQSMPLRAWLPEGLPEGTAAIMASRAGVAVDVPPSHPARSHIYRLLPSEAAADLRELAELELDRALGQAKLAYRVVGYLAVAGGGLTSADLAEIARVGGYECLGAEIDALLRRGLARTVEQSPDPLNPDAHVLTFGHQVLSQTARAHFVADRARLAEHLRRWADTYRQSRWPSHTPSYLLTGYRQFLRSQVTSDTLDSQASARLLTELLEDENYQQIILDAFGWLYPYIEDVKFLAGIDAAYARRIGLSIMRAKRPNSYLRRQMLGILVGLPTMSSEATRSRHQVRLDDVVWALQQQPVDSKWLKEKYRAYARSSTSPVRSALLLAIGCAGGPENAAFLLQILRSSQRRTAWAAADALIEVAESTTSVKEQVVEELSDRFLEVRGEGDRQRILYVLSFLGAEGSRALAHSALSSGNQRTAGWAVHLLQEVGPTEQDVESWLDTLEQVTSGRALGPWRGLWAQKRLIRGLHHALLSRQQCLRATELADQLLEQLKSPGFARPSPERNSLFLAARRLRDRPCPFESTSSASQAGVGDPTRTG